MIFIQIFKKLRRILDAGILQVLLWAALLNVVFGVGFYYAERNVQEGLTLVDSLWWSMVTMTTVGYGDFYAQTPIGRFLISYPTMILGIGVIGYLVGVVANGLLEWAARKRKGEMDITIKNHIILCNYPGEAKFLQVVDELKAVPIYRERTFVLVTDQLMELPEKLSRLGFLFVHGSTTDETVLMRANILECEGVLILAENPADERSDDRTFTVGSIIELIGKEHQREIKTIAELVTERSIRALERASVDGIVSSEGVSSCLLSQEFQHPGLARVISQMITTTRGSQLYLYNTVLEDHSIVELQKAVLEHEANLQIIGIIHRGEYILNPPKKLRISKGDRLIILAEHEFDLSAIERDLVAKG